MRVLNSIGYQVTPYSNSKFSGFSLFGSARSMECLICLFNLLCWFQLQRSVNPLGLDGVSGHEIRPEHWPLASGDVPHTWMDVIAACPDADCAYWWRQSVFPAHSSSQGFQHLSPAPPISAHPVRYQFTCENAPYHPGQALFSYSLKWGLDEFPTAAPQRVPGVFWPRRRPCS